MEAKVIMPQAQEGFIRRAWKSLTGEISAMVTNRPVYLGGLGSYRLESQRVDYDLARRLYRNIDDGYKLGGAFAKPVVNSVVGFMGVPAFTYGDDTEMNAAIEKILLRWEGKIFRLTRNTLRDGDIYARIMFSPSKFNTGAEQFELNLIPPEWVFPVVDPINGGFLEVTITYPYVKVTDGGWQDNYNIREIIRPKEIVIEVDSTAPDAVKAIAGTVKNEWGFIPIVCFRNEQEEYQTNGLSELESLEPFMKSYHDTMLFAVQGGKMFSRPKAKFKLRDVQSFLTNNFSAQEINSGKLSFANKEIYLMEQDDDAEFITSDSGLNSITTLLEFLFYCVVDVSETPEFCFGTAVSSSKASVSEQMVPFTKKIRRKRGMFGEPLMELGIMLATMWGMVRSKKPETYEPDITWEALSQKNDQEIASTIKDITEGLATAIDAQILSVQAASEFLREFVPSMLPYMDDTSESDEARRIAEGLNVTNSNRESIGLQRKTEGVDDLNEE